jgi:hypothetical protein
MHFPKKKEHRFPKQVNHNKPIQLEAKKRNPYFSLRLESPNGLESLE